LFDCLVREVAGEEADGAVVEGRRGWQGAARAGGVEGVEVAEPGGEGEGGSGGLVAANGEAVDVGAEEGDLGEGKGEGTNLLGAQAVFEGVEVAPSAGSGQAQGRLLGAPAPGRLPPRGMGTSLLSVGGCTAPTGRGGMGAPMHRGPSALLRAGAGHGRGKRRPYGCMIG
jgi:hypothetical protein